MGQSYKPFDAASYGKPGIVLGSIISAIGLAFVAHSIYLLVLQHYRLATYVPGSAQIQSSVVQQHTSHDKSGTHYSYSPEISYSYIVAGKTYFSGSAQTLPIPNSGSFDWASQLVNANPPGSQTTAYHSSADPHFAFLIRHVSRAPHITSFIPLIFVVLGFLLVYAGLTTPIRPPLPVGAGGFRIRPQSTIRGNLRLSAAIAIAWIAYSGFVIGDDYIVSGHTVDAFVMIASWIAAILAAIPLWFAYRWAKMAGNFGDAEVIMTQDRVRPGEICDVRMQLMLLSPLQIDKCELGIVCMRTDRQGSGRNAKFTTTDVWRSWHTVESQRSHPMSSQIKAQVQFAVPLEAMPSGTSLGVAYPRFAWHIAMNVSAVGLPMLKMKFPIWVEAEESPVFASTDAKGAMR
jgi:hypothetical protein